MAEEKELEGRINNYEYIVFEPDAGSGMKIELRRRGNLYEFRPLYNDNPRNYAAIAANAELRAQGGAWAPVPSNLMGQAIEAFEK